MITLLYHDVVAPGEFASSGFVSGDANIYKLEQPEFALHLEKIRQRASVKEVAVLRSRSDHASANRLLFTFDDGGSSSLLIADMLEHHGWRGHFFITTDYIDKPGFLTVPQIQELHRRGHVVGSHSCSHPLRMSHCSEEQLRAEWSESLRVLAHIVGEKVLTASVPGGYYSRKVAEAAAESGIEVLFNSEPTLEVYKLDGCLVLGRYSIQQGVSALAAASIARGDWAPRFRQSFLWKSKKIAKRLAGNHYITVRKALLKDV
jgi:peptidoglycan/xylan/chitin deacetylase (PgdA/CDA1 family)